MINQDIIAQDLFYKIRSRFPKMEMGNEDGEPTFEATKGRFFDFDAVFEGKNLGTVSISINEPGSLKIYFSKNILEDSDDYTATTWFNFLKEMRKFAMKRLMSFDTRDISKTNLDKRDYGYLAKKESVMTESMMKGTSRTSYKPLERTRLIIRHSKPVDESIPGSRSRNIQSLFIENEAGERFKYPFVHKAGAEAMQRHVANGGVPHDPIGEKIIEISEQIAQLSSFKNYVQREDLMNTETNHIVDRAAIKLENLKETIKKLSRQHHYEAFKNQIESGFVKSEKPLIDAVTMEEYKDKFTVKSFKEDIANVFPLLYTIMQEENEIDLENIIQTEEDLEKTATQVQTPDEIFENWADTLIETKLTPEDLESLRDLLDEHFPVGVNGENASESLENLGLKINDVTKLSLAKLAETDGPDADASSLIKEFLSKNEPEIYQMLGVESAQVEEDNTLGPFGTVDYSDLDDKGHPRLNPAQAKMVWDHPNHDPNLSANAQWDKHFDKKGYQRLSHDQAMQISKHPNYNPNLSANAQSNLLSKNEDRKTTENTGMMTDEERKAANDYIRKISADIKSGAVSPEEVENDFYYTLELYGIDDDKIMSAWQRITDTGYKPITQRKDVSDKDIDNELNAMKGDEEDDDAAFLANLRNKAKTGSVKTDTTGFGAGLDEENTGKGSSKEIAEFIMSFYDRENGTFPLGETGVKIKVEKQFGEKAGQLAQKLIQEMSVAREERDAFEELKMLSGMKKPAEGNFFTGNLEKARQAGLKKADLDGDGDMEPIHSENTLEFESIRRLAGIK